MFENIMTYIKPELLVLSVVLCVLGAVLKRSSTVSDKYIPLVLGALGVVLALAWVLSGSPISTAQEGFAAAFTAVIQGILCAGASVYAHQLIKQTGKKE